MASRNNPYQRDPALAQAFNNIAGMFAPPSGSDAAGFATANAKRAEAQRLADLFAYSKDPNFDRGAFERQAIAAGLYNPTQSYYRVDQDNATSRANNAADNSRALDQTRLQQTGETTRTMLAPVAQGATRFVPPSIAQLYGVPGTQVGAISVNPGDRVVTPDGRTIEGAPKPLSETEMKAAILGRQPEQTQTDFVLGGQSPVVARGADGRDRYTAPGVAMREGLSPGVAPGSAPVRRSEGVAIINGKQVAVTRAPDGLQWQLPDGQPVPPDARVMDLPKATGSNDQLGLPTTANNTAANNQAAEVSRALSILDIYEELINKNPGAIGIVGAIRGTAQNLGASVGDLAKSFGGRAPQIGEAAAALQNGMKGVAPDFFDPSIPEAEFLQGTLAYALARTENPSGEVSRQAFERALDRVRGGGLLANTDAARAAISANRKVLNTQLQSIQTLRGQQPARNDAGYQPAPEAPRTMPAPDAPVERWTRDANGNLVRAQ